MREPKPFFRKQTQTYYVKLNGTWHALGPDKEGAWQRYHELMAEFRTQRVVKSGLSVHELLDRYYEWCQRETAETTAENRKPILKAFAKWIGPRRLARSLKPFHIDDFISETYDKPSSTYKHRIISTLKQAFSWAVEKGHLSADPISTLKKPSQTVRQEFIPYVDWDKLLAGATDDDFRDFLLVALVSGARANEMMNLEARFLDRANCRFIFPIPRSKGRKRNRVVYLPAEAFEIVCRMAEKNPDGPLFRNRRGRKWTKNAVRCRFRRLKAIMKMPDLRMTSLRHSFAHHRLTTGQDSQVVSKLLGHVDGRMLETRYGHIDQDTTFMQNEANRINYLPSLHDFAGPNTGPNQPA